MSRRPAAQSPSVDVSPPLPEKAGEYVVVARRYRPGSFEDLVGQQQASQALRNAIKTNRVGHAYLFTGARGVGKTSTARIFAKCLNCVQGPTPTPCGQCDPCQSIASGGDVDVLEIDGASNRGIDEIRQLRSNVNARPSRSHFKIYIIDEVHMLTPAAFNALLKTLEEPPEHVKFVFCTTDPEKIPITVLSRCQRFDFAPVAAEAIVDRLRHIVATEGLTAEDAALQLLARRASGSMRDSQSLLEQLLSFSSGRITEQAVHEMLGTAQNTRLAAVAMQLTQRDAAAALAHLDAAVREGVDVGQLAEQLLGYLRDMVIAALGCPADLMLQASPADHQQLAQSGQQMGLPRMLAAIQILDQAITRMRQSPHVRTLVEIALVRICSLEDLEDLSRLIAQLQADPLPGAAPPRVARPAPAAAVQKKTERLTADLSSAIVAERVPTAAEPPPSEKPSPPPEVSSAKSARSGAAENSTTTAERLTTTAGENPLSQIPDATPSKGAPEAAAQLPWTLETAEDHWRDATARVGGVTCDVAGDYELIAISAPNVLVVTLKTPYNKEWCERPDVKRKIDQALAEVVGRPIRVEFQLSAAPVPKSVAERRPPTQQRAQKLRELEQHPLVQEAMELFAAEVVSVDTKQR